MKKWILSITILILISTSSYALQKPDLIKFREQDYISSCGPNTKCRMCFDIIKKQELSDSSTNWKTHITDVDTRKIDLTNRVTNFNILQVTTDEVDDISYQQIKTEKEYTCNYTLNYTTPNYAWCYETYIEPINLTQKTRIHHERAFTRKNDKTKTIWWDETINDINNPITKKTNKRAETKITDSQIKSIIKNAQIGTEHTVCLEGNVQLGEKVDVYPEIFGYNYTEYAIWEGNKVSLLFSNWSEWDNTRFNNTVWMPYAHVVNDNLTLDYVYLHGFNLTFANGSIDPIANGGGQTFSVLSTSSVLNMSNDYGIRRTATATGGFGVTMETLSITKNYTHVYDIYSVATTTNAVLGFVHNTGTSGCSPSTFYFTNGKIHRLGSGADTQDSCGNLDTLIDFTDGRWIHVELKHVNYSRGMLGEVHINGTLTNKSLGGVTMTSNIIAVRFSTDSASINQHFDTVRTCEERADTGNCNYTTSGIIQSYPITFGTSFNQVNCTYLATTPTGTSAIVNVSANNGTSWITCNNNAITTLGDTVSSLIANIELSGNATARPMMNYALNLTVSTSGGVQGGSSGNNSNETAGDDAIELAINSSLTNPAKFKSRQLYVRYFNSSQIFGRFDWFVMQASPPRRWAINYITANDQTSGFTYMLNITPVFWVLELQNLTQANLTDTVGDFINSTKN
ncbi:MAG: hypothetical protein AABY14_01070 [Nanoarchaeota archaeon]